jgi:hypothetical protein
MFFWAYLFQGLSLAHKLPKRVIWGPKWSGFGMLLGYGSHNLQVSSSALICRAESNAAELETCQLRGPYRIGCGVNPTFWAAICYVWPASAPNLVIFSVLKSL